MYYSTLAVTAIIGLIIATKNVEACSSKSPMRTRTSKDACEKIGYTYDQKYGCYKLYKFDVKENFKNFTEGRKLCQKDGADLVIIDSKEKVEHLYKTFKNMTTKTRVGIKTTDLMNTSIIYSTNKNGSKQIKKIGCEVWQAVKEMPFKARCLNWTYFEWRALRHDRPWSDYFELADGRPLYYRHDFDREAYCRYHTKPDEPFPMLHTQLSCSPKPYNGWEDSVRWIYPPLRVCKTWLDDSKKVVYNDTKCEDWVTEDWIPLNSTGKVRHSPDGRILNETYQQWVNIRDEPLGVKDLDWFPKTYLDGEYYNRREHCLILHLEDKVSYSVYSCNYDFSAYICEKV